MGQERNPRRVAENEAFAVNRFMRVSPQKLNLVAQMIRGKKVDKALAELTFSRKRISGQVKRTLESAIANAENNHQLDVDNLIVAQAYVGKRLVMRRFHARGRGRAGAVEKFFSQLTIVVRETDGEEPKRKGKGRKAGKPAAEAAAT